MKLLKQNAKWKGVLEYEPELRYTPTGNALTVFAITVNEDETIRCEAWGDIAERIIERDMQTGAEIEVTGSMKTRAWHSDEDHEYDYVSVTAIGI